MVCIACGASARGGLCGRCRSTLQPGGELLVGATTVVRAAFVHTGAARVLVHRLKYQGLTAAAGLLAAAMAPLLEPTPPLLVPVPRAVARRWRYGVDPGPEIAAALRALTGIPVCPALAPGWWHRRRAGPGGAIRGVPGLARRLPVLPGCVLVDDVVTTGSTLAVAATALAVRADALTATAARSAARGGGGGNL